MKQVFLTVLGIIFCTITVAQKANIPGDFPDPTVIKWGDSYYASATSSNWQPGYPILKSDDLKNWEWVANIFPEKPDWVNNSFWAPELHVDKGRVYVYYTARKKGGGLCVAVASADHPEGPYIDHGPLICEPIVGSIDGFSLRDEEDNLFFIWKTDGNSQRQPTPMWIQEMNEERTALIGEPVEMFRNDMPWEGNLIEGAAVVKHGEYYYAFYAAAGCCGKGCTYKTGLARAKNLLGPWEKDPRNPIMVDEENWKCQGHGTPIDKDGKHYFMYHAYNKETSVYNGRQTLLREYVVNEDNWIDFTPEFIESEPLKRKFLCSNKSYFSDDFNSTELKPSWNWHVTHDPEIKLNSKQLKLTTEFNDRATLLVQKVQGKNYASSVKVNLRECSSWSGLGVIGDDKKYIAIIARGNKIILTTSPSEDNKMLEAKEIVDSNVVYLKAEIRNNTKVNFFYSTDGKKYLQINEKPLDASKLPPWDRATRAGLVSIGEQGGVSVFDDFKIFKID